MPRYVILAHDYPMRHWDLMLEAGDVLRTWRLLAPPEPGRSVAAEASFDHRVAYLDYEGPVSGGRGTVVRWDWGEYAPALEYATRADGVVQVVLRGERLRGSVRLERDAAGAWVFTVAVEDGAPGQLPSGGNATSGLA
jgi:hypothetical protein